MLDPACLEDVEKILDCVLSSCRQRGIPVHRISLTGAGFNGTVAQFLALKYGLAADCFDPDPLGASTQNKLGFDRIGENAAAVHSYLPANLTVSMATMVLDGWLFGHLGIQTPGVFSMRIEIPVVKARARQNRRWAEADYSCPDRKKCESGRGAGSLRLRHKKVGTHTLSHHLASLALASAVHEATKTEGRPLRDGPNNLATTYSHTAAWRHYHRRAGA